MYYAVKKTPYYIIHVTYSQAKNIIWKTTGQHNYQSDDGGNKASDIVFYCIIKVTEHNN